MAEVVTRISVNYTTKDIGAEYNEKGQRLVDVFANKQILEDKYYTAEYIDENYVDQQFVANYYAERNHTHSDYATTSTLSNYYTQTQIRANYYDKQDLDTYFQTKDINPIQIGTSIGVSNVEGAIGALNTYINQVNRDAAKTADVATLVTTTIQDMRNNGELNIEAERTKKVEFFSNQKAITTAPLSQFNHTLVKVVLFDTQFSSDSEYGFARIQFEDGTTKEKQLGSSYWEKGSTFEIYESLLVCTNSKGDKECIINNDTTKKWMYFELSELSQSISCMVFREGWDDMEEEA